MNPIDPNNFLDITKASDQEVFDFAVNHLRKQGKQSKQGDGCMYKHPDGLMCAAAPFIRNYADYMEGTNYNSIVEDDADCFGEGVENNQPYDHSDLITRLQSIHDLVNFKSPSDWEPMFQDLASRFELIYTPPQTISTANQGETQ